MSVEFTIKIPHLKYSRAISVESQNGKKFGNDYFELFRSVNPELRIELVAGKIIVTSPSDKIAGEAQKTNDKR